MQHKSYGFCGDYPGSDLRKMMWRKMFEKIRHGEWASLQETPFSQHSATTIMARQIDIKPLDDQRIDEWSKEFEDLMFSRLLSGISPCYEWYRRITGHMKTRLRLGGMRYGWLASPDKPQYDRLKDIETNRLIIFQNCHDPRLLADIANFCLLEFVEGDHPARHLPNPDKADNKNYLSSLTNFVSSLTPKSKLDLIPILVREFKATQSLTTLADVAAIAILASAECSWDKANLLVDDESCHTEVRIQT